MNPESPVTPPINAESSRKKLLLLSVVVGLVGSAIVVLIVIFAMKSGDKSQPKAMPSVSKVIQTSVSQTAFHYAENSQYDACTLLTLNTVKQYAKGYAGILANLGTNKVANDPLTLEHAYLDRDIPTTLGADDRARPVGLDSGPRAFLSPLDSHCVYGQGIEIGRHLEFASVYVVQRPTPLSAKFLAYLDGMADKKQTVKSLDIYVVPPSASDNFYTVIMVKHDQSAAVILQTADKDLATHGADEIGPKLEAAPTGPLRVSYPALYAKLIDTCKLLSADDFQQFTGKPASAFAQETLYLTDVNALSLSEALRPVVSGVRQCERLEVDRSTATNIAQTTLTLRQFRNESSAKKFVGDQRDDDIDTLTITTSKHAVKGVSEAYIKADEDPGPFSPVYTWEMRIGTAVITLDVQGDKLQPDNSTAAFEARLLPIAQKVADNYLKQAK